MTTKSPKTKIARLKEWFAALRSGKYKQGTGMLCYADAGGHLHYCCIGVACEVYAKYHPKEKWEINQSNANMTFCGEDAVFPQKVAKWFGFTVVNPVIGQTGHAVIQATSANDSHCLTFKEIADMGEKYLLEQ